MPTTPHPHEPSQTLLLPSDPRDWLPPDNLVSGMGDLVDIPELVLFYARYEGDGHRNCSFDVVGPSNRPGKHVGLASPDCPLVQ